MTIKPCQNANASYARNFSQPPLHKASSADPFGQRDSQRPKQLLRAGVDLSKRETVQAVIDQLDAMVTQIESEAPRSRNAIALPPKRQSEAARIALRSLRYETTQRDDALADCKRWPTRSRVA